MLVIGENFRIIQRMVDLKKQRIQAVLIYSVNFEVSENKGYHSGIFTDSNTESGFLHLI